MAKFSFLIAGIHCNNIIIWRHVDLKLELPKGSLNIEKAIL